MFPDDGACFLKIRNEISAKMQAATGSGPRRNRVEKVGLQDAMFVMPEFGPWIRKEDEERGDASVRRQAFQEESGIGPKEMEIGEAGTVALTTRALDSLSHQVYAHADPLGMRGRIRRQKVPVSTPDLTDKIHRCGKNRRERLPQDATTLL